MFSDMDLDLNRIQDEQARQLVVRLLNLIETLTTDLRHTQAEVQRLRDEMRRLQGEQGQPPVRPNTPQPPRDYSSEAERRQPKPRQKRAKRATLVIHREETVRVDRTTLPPDARFKGYEKVVVQDVSFRADNVRFRKEKFWSPSARQTYLAPLPPGYRGQFGPGLRALTVTLSFGAGMSEPAIRALYAHVGIQISAGQVSELLIHRHDALRAEEQAAWEAGLEVSPYQHIDQTGTRVDGQNQHCTIVCNPLATHYTTTPSKDRLSVLDALRPGRPRRFRLNAEALGYLEGISLPQTLRRGLAEVAGEGEWTEEALVGWLKEAWPALGETARQMVLSAAALAAYHAEEAWRRVRVLVADDAPQFRGIAPELALCWVHEGRHYKKLLPVFAHHLELLEGFRAQFWDYYRQFLAYRERPDPAERERLEGAFDRLFATRTGYDALDARIAQTAKNKAALLVGLAHPEVPLHNNPAELAARRRVRKREVSYGPRTPEGVRAWDTLMSLVATTRQLGISFHQYLHDRLSGAHRIPPLADTIRARATERGWGGASWAPT
jgi:hypothetical protein